MESMMHKSRSVPGNQRELGFRKGFSLIELIMVIGVIAILTAILIAAVAPGIEAAKVGATKVTVMQLGGIVKERVSAIMELDVSSDAKKLKQLNSATIKTLPQAEFLIRKAILRQAFPQRMADVYGLDGVVNGDAIDLPSLAKKEWDVASFPVTTTDVGEINSALFYFAITQISSVKVLESGASYSLPVIDPGIVNPRHVRDVDLDASSSENRKPIFADSWDQPLRFYAWPTRLFWRDTSGSVDAADTANAKLLVSAVPEDISANGPRYLDSLDQAGTLGTPFVGSPLQLNLGSGAVTINSFGESAYHTPNAYSVPLVISCGPDGILGLGEPASATPAHRLGLVISLDGVLDNISSQQN